MATAGIWWKVVFQTVMNLPLQKSKSLEIQSKFGIAQNCPEQIYWLEPSKRHVSETELVWSGINRNAWMNQGFPSHLNMTLISFGGGVGRFLNLNKCSLHREILTLSSGWISWSWEGAAMSWCLCPHHVEFPLDPFKERSVVSIFIMHFFWTRPLGFLFYGFKY